MELVYLTTVKVTCGENLSEHPNNSFLRSILDTVMDGIITIDENGTIFEFNPAASKIFGYESSEAIGKNVSIIIPDPYRNEHDGYVRRYVSTGKSNIIGKIQEITGRRKDGTIVPIELIVSQFEMNGNHFFIGSVKDITIRKQALSDLAKSERRLQTVLNTVVDGIITINRDGLIVQVNPAALRVFGYSPEEVIGRSFKILMLEEFGNEYELYLKSYIQTGIKQITGVAREVVGIRNDRSTFPSELTISLYTVDDVPYFTGIIRELTAEKLAQKKIYMLNESLLLRTNELESTNKELEAFSYSVSHDLRAPLRHVNGYIDLLKKRVTSQLDEKSAHYFDVIEEASSKMNQLIDGLLQFSRNSRAELVMNSMDFNRIILDVIKESQLENQQRKIEWKIADLPRLSGDSSLFRQVWANLIGNALKYTRLCETAVIEISYRQEGENVIFSIRDNGVGFDQAFVTKLFGVFQRLHSDTQFEGTGIGLANVKRIVERHGGSVWAEGELKKGAVFSFSLKAAI